MSNPTSPTAAYSSPLCPRLKIESATWFSEKKGVFINPVGRRSCMLNPRLGLGWRFPLLWHSYGTLALASYEDNIC